MSGLTSLYATVSVKFGVIGNWGNMKVKSLLCTKKQNAFGSQDGRK